MNAPVIPRAMESVTPAMELLLACHPLIRILRGARKETLMRLWRRAAIAEARQVLDRQERALPDNPKAALLELHQCVLEMGEALDVGRIEFMDAFNARGEAGAIPEGISPATERCVALLALFCARRLEQQL